MEPSSYREIILDHFKSGKTAIEIENYMKNLYGDSKPSYSTIKRWVASFKTGHTNTQNEARTGHPISAIPML